MRTQEGPCRGCAFPVVSTNIIENVSQRAGKQRPKPFATREPWGKRLPTEQLVNFWGTRNVR